MRNKPEWIGYCSLLLSFLILPFSQKPTNAQSPSTGGILVQDPAWNPLAEFLNSTIAFQEGLWFDLFESEWEIDSSAYHLDEPILAQGTYSGTNSEGALFAITVDLAGVLTTADILKDETIPPDIAADWATLNYSFTLVNGQLSTRRNSRIFFGFANSITLADGTTLNTLFPIKRGHDFGTFSGIPEYGTFAFGPGSFPIPPAPSCNMMIPADYCNNAPPLPCPETCEWDLFTCKRKNLVCLDELCSAYETAKDQAYDEYGEIMDAGREAAGEEAKRVCKAWKMGVDSVRGALLGGRFGGLLGGIAGGVGGGLYGFKSFLDCTDGVIGAIMGAVHEVALNGFHDAINAARDAFTEGLAECCVTCPGSSTPPKDEQNHSPRGGGKTPLGDSTQHNPVEKD